MRPRAGPESGFSLVEVLLALTIGLGLAIGALAVLHGFSRALGTTYASLGGVAAIDQRLADMRSQSATALSVFVPASDVYGRPNAPLGGTGHEIDFYSRSGTRAPIYWAYVYDAAAGTLQRVDYDPAGDRGVRDPASGAIDTHASYPALGGIAAFTAQGLMASQIASRAGAYGAAYSEGSRHAIVDLPVSLDDDAVSRPDNYAGNTIVQLHLRARNVDRYVHLAAGEFPTGFTYQGATKYHVVLWRTDTTVKHFFATKSYVYIWADVDVTYDDWVHYEVWCHRVPIYGEPKGLRDGDPHENYNGWDPQNSGNYALGVCIDGTGTPGDNGYYPAHGAPPAPDPLASLYPRRSGS